MTLRRSETGLTLAGMPVAALVGIIATVTVFAVSQGLSYPLLSFILQRQGETPATIGASAAMTPLGFIASAPLIPAMAARFGAARLALACAALAALTLALIGLLQHATAWLPLRFLLGFVANPLYVVSETWLLSIVPSAIRGRVMGVYTSVISAGFALGPLALSFVGSEGALPFAIGVGAFLTCGACLVSVLPRLPPMDHERAPTSVPGFFLKAPLLTLAVFTTAGFEQAVLALLGTYGAAHGEPETRVAVLLTVFIAGNIALQMPLGLLAERIGVRAALTLCAAACALGCALLPLALGSWTVWPMVFVWGAAAFGMYTLALIDLGTRYSGALLITGNAAFALVWGIGGILVPPVTGTVMDGLGPEGLPVTLGVLCTVLVVCAAFGLRRGRGA